MCKVMEDMRLSVAKEAAEQTKVEIARDMISGGELSLEQIAKYLRLEPERVKEISNQKNYY